MKTLLRLFLINVVSLTVTARLIPGFTIAGGFKSLAIGAVAFMLINWLLVPLLKVLFLPLNLLTVGLFAWLINVLALYALTTLVSEFALVPYRFSGINLNVINIPPMDLTVFWVAVLASLSIGIITHFLQWLVH